MRKCMLHLAQTFCAGSVRAANEGGNRAAVKLAVVGNMGTGVEAAGDKVGVNGKVVIGKPVYGMPMLSA